MRSAITVSIVPEAKSGPFVFSDGLEAACEQAAEIGFDAIEVFPPSGEEVDVRQLSLLLERHRLRVAAMGTGGGWVVRKLTLTHKDESVRREAREFVRAVIQTAGRFGAPAIIGSMQGRWDGAVDRETALRHLADALVELADHAALFGVPLLYEPLNRYETNLLNRLGDAADWLRALPTRNVRLLADLFHMNIDESNSAAALRDAGALIGHVHLADSNRRAMGMGQTLMEPIAAALRAMQFSGYASAEILPLPDPMAAARQTMAAFQQYLAAR